MFSRIDNTYSTLPLICFAQSWRRLTTHRIPTCFTRKIIAFGSIWAIKCIIIGGASLSTRAFAARFISLIWLKKIKKFFWFIHPEWYLLCIDNHYFHMSQMSPRPQLDSNTFSLPIYYNQAPYNSMNLDLKKFHWCMSLFHQRVRSNYWVFF